MMWGQNDSSKHLNKINGPMKFPQKSQQLNVPLLSIFPMLYLTYDVVYLLSSGRVSYYAWLTSGFHRCYQYIFR